MSPFVVGTPALASAQGTSWDRGTSWNRQGTSWNRQGTSWGRRVAAALLAVSLGAWLLAAPGATPDRSGPMAQVLVQPATALARSAVRAVGGTVGAGVDLIDGFIASVPSGRAGELTDLPGINVTADHPVEPADADVATAGGTSLDLVRDAVGVTSANGGGSIGVAQIDSGVANVPALANVRRGHDTAGGSGVDGLGHGTHMAGIIAGNGAGFTGVAPAARLISVDAAKADGSTTLLDVLQAMDWVAAHKNEANIRVLNLSLAVDPLADPRLDPMAYGVEALSAYGIVVVVAGGNRGETSGVVTSPGYAPSAITVGAVDVHGTASAADDTVASFSPAGSAQRWVDLVAPGVSITSVRAPGSVIDTAYPAARVGADQFKGSGTSQATAVVSGVVANLLASRPNLTPAQVKSVLVAAATPLAGAPASSQGGGLVNLTRALTTAPTSGTGGGAFFGGLPSLPSLLTPWAGTGWGGTGWGGTGWGGTGWGGTGWGGTGWGGTGWGGTGWGGTGWGGTGWGGTGWGGTGWGGTGWGGTGWGGTGWGGTGWGGTGWGGTGWGSANWAS